jgi:hypothetical protein
VPAPLRQPRFLLIAILIFAATLAVGAAHARGALASTSEAQVLEDDGQLLQHPNTAVLEARALGFNVIRVMMYWGTVAPSASSPEPPAHFSASDPADYPAVNWAPYDALVRYASAAGIAVDIDMMGGAPLWATGPNMPRGSGYPHYSWEPNAADYGAFVKAVGERYDGNFDPVTGRLQPGNPADLPRVDFWSIWNEPNYGPSLSPQAIPGSNSVPDAPRLLRALLDHAWGALAATGHYASANATTASTGMSIPSDTIIWGELAPRGEPTFGNFNGMLPIPFLQALYCVGANDKPVRGKLATQLGCPTNAAGTARFASENPALFDASGVSVHPYMRWYPPDDEEYTPKIYVGSGRHRHALSTAQWSSQYLSQYTTLAVIGHLTTTLDRLVRVYHGTARFPIWDTEFGYITSPPKRRTKKDPYPYVNPGTAAYYDNWAEYLSYANPRLASFDQYLLQDPVKPTATDDWGNFASGLLTWDGLPKPGYNAFRMPIFLPQTTAATAYTKLLVWGAVKPAEFARIDLPYTAESARLLFKPVGAATYSTIATVQLTGPAANYQQKLDFPVSGTLLAEWVPPADDLLGIPAISGSELGTPIYSRPVQITVK